MRKLMLCACAAAAALVLFVGSVLADQKTPTPPAPTNPATIEIGARPAGQIAFIKDGGIWMMDSDGKNRRKISDVMNAKGRLSFSPDNKIIAFSREGKDASKLPSEEGGMHLLHDIFLAYVDSAGANLNWWKRVTFGLGGYYPEWSANDTVIHYQNDVNANKVDYIVPSHQPANVNINDGQADYWRKDWQTLTTSLQTPSFSPDGKKVAYVINYSDNPDQYVFTLHGIRILPMSETMTPETELRKPSKGLENAIAPAWSPNSQWLAYLSNDMRNPGIYIIKSDLTENRLVFAPSATQQISPHPVGWAPDSKWLTFASMDGTIYIIDINGQRLSPISGPGKHSNPTWSK